MSYRGESNCTEFPAERNFDPASGWSVTRVFRGTPTGILAKMSELSSDGCALTLQPSEDGSYDSLRATYKWSADDPTGQNPEAPISDKWSLIGNDLEKRLWELPKVVTELNKLSDDADLTKMQKIAFLRRFCMAVNDGELTLVFPTSGAVIPVNDTGLSTILSGTTISITVIKGLINCLCKGVEVFPVAQFVLRRTIKKGPFGTTKPNYDNIGKVYSTAALITAESIPDELPFDLPVGYWLKKTPTCEDTEPGVWTITQEWWHMDQPELFIYEVAT